MEFEALVTRSCSWGYNLHRAIERLRFIKAYGHKSLLLLLLVACCRSPDVAESAGRDSQQKVDTDSQTVTSVESISPQQENPLDNLVVPPAEVWVHYGTETPSFCLVLDSDSSGRFMGGFEYLNPVQWSVNDLDERLSLTIPALDSTASSVHMWHAQRGNIAGYDSTTRTIHFHFDSTTTILYYSGYGLIRVDSIADFEYPYVHSACLMYLDRRSER